MEKESRGTETIRRIVNNSVLLVASIFLLVVSAGAQQREKFPTKPITIVINFAAGSGADSELRLIQPYLQQHLGVSITLENAPGAGGRIGCARVFKAPNNGYTLLGSGWAPAPIVGEFLFNAGYKTLEFTSIAGWNKSNFVLVVNSETWPSMEAFVQAARARKLSCGMSGMASAARVLGEALLDVTGIKEMSWVDFGGGSESITQLAGKHIDLVITSSASALPLVRAGKIRPLIVFSHERESAFPETPTTKELGYSIEPLSQYRAIVGPPGLSSDKVQVLEEAVVKAANEPDFQKKMKDRGLDVSIVRHDMLHKETAASYYAIQKYISRIGIAKQEK